MQVHTFTFNDFLEKTYIVSDETLECVIVDPGCHSKKEVGELIDFVEQKKLKPVKIINTHCHVDHVLGVDALKNHFNIKFHASKDDKYLFDNLVPTARNFGIIIRKAPKIDVYISGENTIEFGNSSLQVLEVPGHSVGHLAFYSEKEKFVISGDVLFKDSIGRTDLPGGDLDVLLDSIRTKLLTLPDDVTIFPGHGYNTTISAEKLNNPFLKQEFANKY